MFCRKNLLKKKALFIYTLLVILASAYFIALTSINSVIEIKCFEKLSEISLPEPKKPDQLTNDYINDKIKESPLIFIGGYARSGTTLMRAILDVHPNVSCGPETKILPAITKFIRDYTKLRKYELKEAGINVSTIDSALSMFLYHILENHIRNAERLCAKDPDILYYMEYLHQLFPKAKFVYMVRDARAVAYSMVNKVEKVKTFAKMIAYIKTWNSLNTNFFFQCDNVGEKACMVVRYEDLILKTNETLRNVTQFLGVSWTDDFMRHNEFVGNKIAVSESEWSTGQIKNPIYMSSINKWRTEIKDYDPSKMSRMVKMLKVFGYLV